MAADRAADLWSSVCALAVGPDSPPTMITKLTAVNEAARDRTVANDTMRGRAPTTHTRDFSRKTAHIGHTRP